MSFRSPVSKIIEGLARQIDRECLSADAVAEKMASPDRHRSDGAKYEAHAESAQLLALEQSKWEWLQDNGFLS